MADSQSAALDMNPLQKAFNLFIMNLPGRDLDEIMSYVHQPGDEDPSFVQNMILKQTAEVLKAVSCNDAGYGTPGSPTGSNHSGRSKKSSDRKLRPLNSFIAFRSFYSTMLTDMTQKSKSGIIRNLWQLDPNKAKWSILAKAYSILRDNHGNDVSLDTFLELTVPFIGLIQPCDYLETMGCKIITIEDQQYEVQRNSLDGPDLSNSATNYSVADIVNYCYDRGYVEELPDFEENEITSQVNFAALPNPRVHTDHGPINLDNVDRAIESDESSRPEVELGPLKSFFQVHEPVMTQYDVLKIIDGAILNLSEANSGDPDFYAPFNPEVQAFPIFDPMAHDAFDGFDISEMNF